MTTVRDLFIETLSLNRQKLAPFDIADRVAASAREGGFRVSLTNNGKTLELSFTGTGELISFDGLEWHHRRT
jgi:hypothetical protein